MICGSNTIILNIHVIEGNLLAGSTWVPGPASGNSFSLQRKKKKKQIDLCSETTPQ